MGASPPSQPRASLPKQLANFTNSAAGLDLTLRLIHALAIVGAEISTDDVIVEKCIIATAQLGLARRYLRFFSFIECFENVYELLGGRSATSGTIAMTMQLVESSCLGMYFLLEDLTMLHDMNIWLVPWYTTVLLEANKFWFYAICVSIIGNIGQLLYGSPTENKAQESKSDTKEETTDVGHPLRPEPSSSTASLLNQVVASSLDLSLPTTFLGWSGLGNREVGAAMTVSTILAWRGAWAKAQA
ncbi:hypothetical protein FQN54_008798 [Arachnomyces sp. PD_36]|nr:hypothetical protein FQN54_008798 [Arachnomyces sp. PD_36]